MRPSAALALALAVVLPATAAAQEAPEASVVEIIPARGATVMIDGRLYEGRLRVAAHTNGIAVTEDIDVESYLLGIREVPFSWDAAALEAQVVAARTYLAWTLQRGRSQNGRAYGYDICATVACQVYAGSAIGDAEGAGRWRSAVQNTAGEILVYQGRPAQALYSSTSGGRTRNVEDVFGSSPIPYLRAVDSPGERSPFARWWFALTGEEFQLLMEAAGLADAPIVDVEMVERTDGEGQTLVRLVTATGERSIGTWDLRSAIHRSQDVLGERLPPPRNDWSGRRYPQTILSPTYRIERQHFYRKYFGGPPVAETWFVFHGNGWGHLVGMSQYGAQAMADSGSSYQEILAHYYGGLTPEDAGALLPERVSVGIAIGLGSLSVMPLGPVTVVVDGETVAESALGAWNLLAVGDRIAATPPVGLGEAPRLSGWRVGFDSTAGVTGLSLAVSAPAEVRVLVELGGEVIRDDGWALVEASRLEWSWAALLGENRFDEPVVVEVSSRSPQGEDTVRLRLLPGSE